MKVLDLQCSNGHTFEGWFGSEADFQNQREHSLVQCPLCGDHGVVKKLSAPRLSLSGHRDAQPAAQAEGQAPATPAQPAEQALATVWLAMARHLIANTTDVGTRFAEEARRMHYGEAEERAIRGQATPEEAQALSEEGIEVLALPLPDILKEPLQ